jgi:prepilin-type N-terminal cleavage/methylation domain-containing protein
VTLDRGITLMELLVVLVLLGIVTSVVGLAMRSAGSLANVNGVDGPQVAAARARDSAVRLGRPVTIVIARDSQPLAVRALPDGRVVADGRLGVDPLSGDPDARP